jgi:hypothetical protein
MAVRPRRDGPKLPKPKPTLGAAAVTNFDFPKKVIFPNEPNLSLKTKGRQLGSPICAAFSPINAPPRPRVKQL